MNVRVVLDYRELARRLAPERAAGRRVALANGCFDLLHVGHLRLLAEARRMADVLVVALNDDASARALKGPGRPFVPLAERAEVVAALRDVDFVTSFPETTAGPLIEALRPALQIKGTDRSPDEVPEREVLERFGGRVVICGDPKTHSSTELGGATRQGLHERVRIGSIVIRCHEWDRMFAFWREALRYEVEHTDPGGGFVILRDPSGRGSSISLDQAPTRRTGQRSWLHLDLYTTDQKGEVERLMGLGATLYPWRYAPGADYVVLEDPDGNLFCVVQLPASEPGKTLPKTDA